MLLEATPKAQLPWHVVAARLADSNAYPAIVLDGASDIQLLSLNFEAIGGWRREEILGRNWLEVFTPHELVERTREHLANAAKGGLHEMDTEILAKDRRRLSLRLQIHGLTGQTKNFEPVTFMTVVSVRALDDDPSFRARDLEYEIAASPIEFGKLVNRGGNSSSSSQHCYAHLESRTSPCEDCPILTRNTEFPRATVRCHGDGYTLITAEVLGPTYRIRRQQVAETAIAAIREAKIDQLAHEAGLSDRERAVLRYLALGRALEDIATILGIRTRTVKFHQTNILEKVGADSRADLSRLLL